MFEVITFVIDKRMKAQAYRVERFSRLITIPPTIANITEGKLYHTTLQNLFLFTILST